METIDRVTPAEGEPIEPRLFQRGWVRSLTAILAVAVLAGGAWLAVDALSGDDLLPGDVQQAIDDYEAAWRTTDEAAFLAATTDNYAFVANGIQTDVATQAFNVGVMSYWKIELQERTATGDGPYIVTSDETVYPSALSSGDAGQSVVTIEEEDGAWKVSKHVWTQSR